jgi:hypothetical protein
LGPASDAESKTDSLGLNGIDQLFAWRNIAINDTPAFAGYATPGAKPTTLKLPPEKIKSPEPFHAGTNSGLEFWSGG